jgi:transcriptional regulator with XRE-family HTH domain
MTGDELKAYRKRKSLTRKEFGADFGVSEHTIAKWEQGTNPIPRAVQRLVAQPPQLELTIEEFRALQAIAEQEGITLEEASIRAVRRGLALPAVVAGAVAIFLYVGDLVPEPIVAMARALWEAFAA